MAVSVCGSGVGRVGGWNVNVAVLHFFVLEQLIDLFWCQAVNAMFAMLTLSLLHGQAVDVRVVVRGESLGEATGSGSMATD